MTLLRNRPRAALRAPALAWVAAACLWAPAAARAEGNGLLVGETARLHVGLDLEGRYDSLAAQGGIGQTRVPVVNPAELIAHLRPAVKLVAPGAELDFDARLLVDWSLYTGWISAQTRELSWLGVEAGAGLLAGKSGPLSLQLDEAFSRSDKSANPALGAGAITNRNVATARGSARPGGGAIEAGLGYSLAVETYELYRTPTLGAGLPCTPSSTPGASCDSLTHAVSLDGRWRFLPKTAVVLDASWARRVYPGAGNVPTSPLRVQAGLAGLVTQKVRVVLKAGYVNLFADSGENFAGVAGLAEVSWSPTLTSKVTLAGQRTVEPVSDLYGWYDDWRASASGQIQLARRFELSGEGRIDALRYANAGARADTQGSLELKLAVEILRELRATTGCVLTAHSSNAGPAFSYSRAEVYLRATVAY